MPSQKADRAQSLCSRPKNDANQAVLRFRRVVGVCMADLSNVVSGKQSLRFLDNCPGGVCLRRIPSHHVQWMRTKRLKPPVGIEKRGDQRV